MYAGGINIFGKNEKRTKNPNNNNNNLSQKTGPYNKQQKKKKKKKRICKILEFAVPADHRIKLKECEKRDKYLDLAREWKKINGTWRWQLYRLWLVLLVH